MAVERRLGDVQLRGERRGGDLLRPSDPAASPPASAGSAACAHRFWSPWRSSPLPRRLPQGKRILPSGERSLPTTARRASTRAASYQRPVRTLPRGPSAAPYDRRSLPTRRGSSRIETTRASTYPGARGCRLTHTVAIPSRRAARRFTSMSSTITARSRDHPLGTQQQPEPREIGLRPIPRVLDGVDRVEEARQPEDVEHRVRVVGGRVREDQLPPGELAQSPGAQRGPPRPSGGARGTGACATGSGADRCRGGASARAASHRSDASIARAGPRPPPRRARAAAARTRSCCG